MKLIFESSTAMALDEVEANAETLTSYIEELHKVATKNIYKNDEASINLPFDDELLGKVEALVDQKVSADLRYVFVVGIGGSNLGTKAIYDALYGVSDVGNAERPKLIFVDTNNSSVLRHLVENIIPGLNSSKEYLLVTISKSGGTTETLANTEILEVPLEEKFNDALSRMVVITDKGSAYAKAAEEENISVLHIPKKVGGRYSVLSAVGLFPLLAVGIDVTLLQKGAQDIRAYCLQSETKTNPAVLSAAVLASALKNGKTINDNFVFNSELESLGKWYRQLLGESAGKEKDLEGKQVNIGITPTVSIGSTDLHSVGQLYLGGPKDKITTFIYSLDNSNAMHVPASDDRTFPTVVEMIDGRSTADIMNAILEGTKIAYNKKDLPFMEVQLEGITPYELGAFMQFKMMEMMYLGKLLNVNPFDQPNVESYKIETKKLLEA